MRSVIILLSALALTGCATAPGATGPGIITIPSVTVPSISPNVDSAVIKVKTVAKQVCGFEPQAASILGVVAELAGIAGVPGASIVSQYAGQAGAAICDVVNRTGASRNGRVPTYGRRHTPIRGHFV